MPNQRFVIALDQGTSSSRAILFDSKLEILGIEQVEVSQSYPNDGWVEQDPLELWNGLIDVAQRLIKNHGLSGKDIASIGIANQRETALVWEKSSGRPVYPAIVWQSRQTAEICQALRASNLESSIRSKTGLTIDSYFSAPKWRFILDHVPNGQSRTENGELLLGTVDSWIIWCLTNGASYMTDETNASRTMIWNIHTGEWDEELMSALNLPEIALPEVKTSGNDFGVTQKDIFGEEIPIRAVAGDQQASLFGHGCNSIGQAKNTYGTGCFILAFAGDTVPDNIDGILTSVAARNALDPRSYVIEGSIFMAGGAIQWLRDGLSLINSAEATEQISFDLADSGGVVVVPAFTGLGSPYWDEDARGAIFGLTRGSNRSHIVRATLESIAHQSADVINAINGANFPVSELRVDGGASANNWLMQQQANILNLPVLRSAVLENTARGVAALAALESSLIDRWPISAERVDRFIPEWTEGERLKSRDRWHRAVKSTQVYGNSFSN
tara:strand:+ start:4140 stop:5639 length:1500 start_codon:yes stop_codon:yes gene_type:complete